MSEKLNHFDAAGNAGMLNVSRKVLTKRVAVSSGKIFVGEEGYHVIKSGTAKKGDVLGVARIAGITAAKKISEIIPLCHTLPLSHCHLDFKMLSEELAVKAVACKAMNKRVMLGKIRLEQNNGGKNGEFKS